MTRREHCKLIMLLSKYMYLHVAGALIQSSKWSIFCNFSAWMTSSDLVFRGVVNFTECFLLCQHKVPSIVNYRGEITFEFFVTRVSSGFCNYYWNGKVTLKIELKKGIGSIKLVPQIETEPKYLFAFLPPKLNPPLNDAQESLGYYTCESTG